MNEGTAPRTVVWSARSKHDLEGIRAYIGQFAPLAAQRFTLRLVTAIENLAQQSHRGRLVRGEVREMVAISPYIVRYRITADAVQIVRIKHGAQRPEA
jgi:plasmid stabilization system protein ParE